MSRRVMNRHELSRGAFECATRSPVTDMGTRALWSWRYVTRRWYAFNSTVKIRFRAAVAIVDNSSLYWHTVIGAIISSSNVITNIVISQYCNKIYSHTASKDNYHHGKMNTFRPRVKSDASVATVCLLRQPSQISPLHDIVAASLLVTTKTSAKMIKNSLVLTEVSSGVNILDDA